jgi:hypothetical protein
MLVNSQREKICTKNILQDTHYISSFILLWAGVEFR